MECKYKIGKDFTIHMYILVVNDLHGAVPWGNEALENPAC